MILSILNINFRRIEMEGVRGFYQILNGGVYIVNEIGNAQYIIARDDHELCVIRHVNLQFCNLLQAGCNILPARF